METMKFKRVNNTEITDLKQYLIDFLNSHPETKIAVGSDSLRFKGSTIYSSVIVLFYPTIIDHDKNGKAIVEYHKGAHVLYTKKRYKGREDLFTRLWNEVYATQEVADFIEKNVYGTDVENTTKRHVEIHLDINSDSDFESNKLFKATTGMFRGMGYEVYAKPDSCVATACADSFCR